MGLIKRTVLCGIAGLVMIMGGILTACQSSGETLKNTQITILHTNDIHGSLDNAPRIITEINQVRSEDGKENVILLDAGDSFTGTLYSNIYNGEVEAWFLNSAGYDAMTPGNHEFDKGSQWLAEYIARMEFPVVNANYDFTADQELHGKVHPWTIVERGGVQIGILGMASVAMKELTSISSEIVLNDEAESVRNAVAELEAQGVNKIIALTHEGWNEDLKLAREVEGIDVVIGAHSHTVPEVYPVEVKGQEGTVLVVQAGDKMQYLGDLKVSFDSEGIITSWDGSQLIQIEDSIVPDTEVEARVAEYQQAINQYKTNIVGEAAVELDGERDRIRSQETNLGDIVADSMLEKTSGKGAEIALISGGGIRETIPIGEINLEQVMKVLPYGNSLVIMDITGEQLKAALENGVSSVEESAGRFPQVAGLRYTWNSEEAAGSRIQSVEIKTDSGYQPVEMPATYRLVTNNYIAGGGDGYTMLKDSQNYIDLGYMDYEALWDYIKTHSPLSTTVEGRIERVKNQ